MVVCLVVRFFLKIVIVVWSCFLFILVVLYSWFSKVINFLEVWDSNRFLIRGLNVVDLIRNWVILFFGDLREVCLIVNMLLSVVKLLFIDVFVIEVKLLLVIVFRDIFIIDICDILNLIFCVVVVLIIVFSFKCRLSKFDMFWCRLFWVVGKLVRFI